MGGASRFLMLLSTPFPLLSPRFPSPSAAVSRLSRRSLSSIYHSAPPTLHPKTKIHHHKPSIFKSQLHSYSQRDATFESKDSPTPPSLVVATEGKGKGRLSWPEWAKFIGNLTGGGYFNGSGGVGDDDDELVGIEEMPGEFVRAAEACLAFSRDRPDALRLLAKTNLEVIVNSISPSLFKNGASSARRMRSFLNGDESNVLEFERAQTIDVMRYVLSYASDSLSISKGMMRSNEQVIEASIRNVLAEFVNMSGTVQASKFTESIPGQPPVQKIEMKRGDWICPKCSFMNFARNSRCLECEEARPKRQLTGREWECPLCNFHNYGRNLSCLRCDCKRPAEIQTGTSYGKGSIIDQILSGNKTGKSELEQRVAANDEKAERWFSKVSQLGDKADTSSPIADEDFPEIMPLRNGVQRRLANSQTRISDGTGSDKPSESSINESLDRILGRTSTPQNMARTDTGHAPFVPLPPGMFGKSQNSDAEENEGNYKNESDASERWSKKVAELDNVTDLASAIPNEDFPDIMPMRKGENRFVVSKKKDRSLTSPQYKRRLAMEQANKSDFIPFVPFPPGYFAKKDKQPEPASPPSVNETVSENSMPPENAQVEPQTYSQNCNTESSGNNLNESKESWNGGISQTSNASNGTGMTWGSSRHEGERPQNSSRSWNSGISQTSSIARSASILRGEQPQSSSQSWNGGNSQTSNASTSTSTSGSSSILGEKSQSSNQSWNRGFTGKSLEGSAVTEEPDPLDMSEEAKAARWFRRAAQIKSISELSEIPDEDFPEIMPMRKGVNRFVVSKRKTPLERRLTSPQYRRNLPIVRSEPENDSS